MHTFCFASKGVKRQINCILVAKKRLTNVTNLLMHVLLLLHYYNSNK